MGHVNWASAITDSQGDVDLVKVGRLVAILLGLGGGLVLMLAMTSVVEAGAHMVLGVSVLVAPLTGSKIADGIAGLRQSGQIQRGERAGRRAEDPE